MKLLGHADVQTMLGVSTHVLEGNEREAVAEVEAFQKKDGTTGPPDTKKEPREGAP